MGLGVQPHTAVKKDVFVPKYTWETTEKQILSQITNCSCDQSYGEVVKDVMGVLDRKAWSSLGGSRKAFQG